MNQVYLMADIHGDWRPVRDFLNRIDNKYDNTDAIIILGDAGLNFFFNHRDENTKTKLNKLGINLFIIRGNHEERPSICAAKNPELWHTEEFWGNTVYVENQFPHIKYALDEVALYHIPYITGYCEGTKENNYNDEGVEYWDFYKALVIPGAYSIDKYHRLANNWSWFEGEQLTKEERTRGWELIEQLKSVDFVFSHTCPCIFEPTDLFLPFVDQSTVDKTMERFCGQVEYMLDYKAWIWGHYHAFRDYPRTDGRKKLMLYNNYAIDVIDYLENEEFKKYAI